MIKAIVLINNTISDKMAFYAINRDKLSHENILIIKLRKFKSNLENDILDAKTIEIPVNGNLFEKFLLVFYIPYALFIFKKLVFSGFIEHVYVVNNINIMCRSAFHIKKKNKLQYKITVLVEGLMNFEKKNIRKTSNIKKLLTILLSKIFSLPNYNMEGHCSGSFSKETDNIVSFSSHGIVAPTEKVQVFEYPKVEISKEPDNDSLMIIHSPLNNIFGSNNYIYLCKNFINWLNDRKYKKIFYKPHPNHKDIYLLNILKKNNVIIWDKNIEDNADLIPAKNIISFFSTALVTLKMQRPDLNIISYGVDFYKKMTDQENDINISKLYNSVGIKFLNIT